MPDSPFLLGFSSGPDISRALQLASETGVDVVELACQHPGQWPADLDAAARHRIASNASGRHLELVVHSDSAVNVAEQHPLVRASVKEHLREYVELSADVGATRLVVHGGLIFDASGHAAALDATVDTLAATAAAAQNAGVTLVLENMNVLDSEIGYFGTTAAEVIAILDAVDSPALRACADLGHAHLLPGGISGFVHALAHRIDYVQLADNDGLVDQHLPLGAGTISLATVRSALEAVGFQGPVVVELDDENDRLCSIGALRATTDD